MLFISSDISCYFSQNTSSSTPTSALFTEFSAISDGGSVLDIIPHEMAKDLIRKGHINHIENETNPFPVRFGKKGAITYVSQYIQGKGLLDKVSVSDDIPVALISDVTLTSKGITIVKQEFELWGFSSLGIVVFYGSRSRSSPKRSLWQIDFLSLFLAPDPRKINSTIFSVEELRNNAALTVPPSVSSALKSANSMKISSGNFSTNPAQVYSARPIFSSSQVTEGRRAQRAVGQLDALARSIDAGAIRSVPAGITSASFRKFSTWVTTSLMC